MKTAEEIKDANKCIPFPHLAVLSVSEIQNIIDEAIAHGMTLAAATAIWQPEHKHCGEIRDAIITARDNKVWKI